MLGKLKKLAVNNKKIIVAVIITFAITGAGAVFAYSHITADSIKNEASTTNKEDVNSGSNNNDNEDTEDGAETTEDKPADNANGSLEPDPEYSNNNDTWSDWEYEDTEWEDEEWEWEASSCDEDKKKEYLANYEERVSGYDLELQNTIDEANREWPSNNHYDTVSREYSIESARRIHKMNVESAEWALNDMLTAINCN